VDDLDLTRALYCAWTTGYAGLLQVAVSRLLRLVFAALLTGRDVVPCNFANAQSSEYSRIRAQGGLKERQWRKDNNEVGSRRKVRRSEVEITAGDWWRTIRAGSDFTTFVTVSHRFWFAVQTLLRHRDVKLTLQFYSHAVSQDRLGRRGGNVNRDSQPRGGSKRTGSGLRKM
jgi:hypothetical protein